MDEEGTGVEPEDAPEAAESNGAAHDGEPSNVTELPTRTGSPLGEDDADADDEGGEEKDGQFTFFVEEDGKKVTLGQLHKRGTPIEVRYAMTGKSMPNVSGGILDPYATSHLMVADCVVDSTKPQYIRDAQQRVEKVILYVTLKPRLVQQAFSEAGQVMLKEGAEARAAAANAA